MRWAAFELHTHTPHSDGRHTLEEMALKAKELGLYGLALTDHNTISGLEARRQVTQNTGVRIVKGMEWTTFYGHMVTLGLREYADWRDLGPHDIHEGIRRVHDQGGIVGVAHPFTLGTPICTGCRWEYTIKDWREVDYMEVWHSLFPSTLHYNQEAFRTWDDLLNRGQRVVGLYGRDWHDSADEGPEAATFLGLDETEPEDIDRAVVEAIRKGRVSVSMGPLLLMNVQAGGVHYQIGDVIRTEGKATASISVQVTVDHTARKSIPELESQPLKLEIESNFGEQAAATLRPGATTVTVQLDPAGLRWFRACLKGVFHGVHTTVAFTNPIYLSPTDSEAAGNR